MTNTNQPHSALAAYAESQASKPQLDLYSVINSLTKNPQDRFYKNQDIFLDGYTFTNCCFSGCRFYTETGIFSFKGCMIMNDCQFIYGQAALRVIKLFNMHSMATNLSPAYTVRGEPNGTISID